MREIKSPERLTLRALFQTLLGAGFKPAIAFLEINHQAALEADQRIDSTARSNEGSNVPKCVGNRCALIHIRKLEPVTGLPVCELAVEGQAFQELPVHAHIRFPSQIVIRDVRHCHSGRSGGAESAAVELTNTRSRIARSVHIDVRTEHVQVRGHRVVQPGSVCEEVLGRPITSLRQSCCCRRRKSLLARHKG